MFAKKAAYAVFLQNKLLSFVNVESAKLWPIFYSLGNKFGAISAYRVFATDARELCCLLSFFFT
jgi:hypothetical protein